MNASGGRREQWAANNPGGEPAYGTPEQILDLIRAAPEGTFDSLLMASGWNLLYHDGLCVLEECQARGIRVHNAGTFATGLLAGGFTFVYAEAPEEMVEATQRWRELCDSYSLPLPAVAMAFSHMPACVDRVVVGCSSVSDVEDCVGHCEQLQQEGGVPAALWREAQAAGLLPASLTLP